MKTHVRYSIIFVLIFVLGWISSDAQSSISGLNVQRPLSIYDNELYSPSDWIKEDSIKIYKNYVVIKVPNATWARFADSNSMDPIIDVDSNSIEIKPGNEGDLKIGDIISYEAEFTKGVIIHRIVKINEDEDGWYATTRGDNNKYNDPHKVRFEQIKGVLVGIVY